MPTEIKVPDLGDFDAVEVIEVLVNPGDKVVAEQPLVTLESDKASMDVPSPTTGRVVSVAVAVGDHVGQGSVIAIMETDDNDDVVATPAEALPEPPPVPQTSAPGAADHHTQVVVLGAGPGGYTAAFRAADLGQTTVLVERYPKLGGVCLNVGCIPSKALLHTAEVISAAKSMATHGVDFGEPSLDVAKLAGWKDQIVGQLTQGLAGLAKQRNVEVITGVGRFTSPHTVEISGPGGITNVHFEKAIIAAGSQATLIPSFPNDDPRVMDSTDALLLDDIPPRLLVIGGGIIGLEMATVYQALGSRITIVERLDALIPGADPDLVRPLAKHLTALCDNIYLSTEVTSVTSTDEGLSVELEGVSGTTKAVFDKVLVAVGRRPNGRNIGAEAAGLVVDEQGFVPSDAEQRTNVPHIFSIGDIKGQPMLAHKATHEGKVAAEVAAGEKSSFAAATIPSVAYTNPEVAWTGLTEAETKAQNIEVKKATFPWAASGKSLGMGRKEGLTKVLFDKATGRLLGAGIVGPHAGDLIAEATLAIEMGADASDLALTIHPHPTLSETINFAAEMVEGTITDLYVPKRRR